MRPCAFRPRDSALARASRSRRKRHGTTAGASSWSAARARSIATASSPAFPCSGRSPRDLVDAGFLVVRYDKRGVGQSGGRAETTTINDYAEDVRAIVTWLEKQRKDVDKHRIGAGRTQ